MCIKYIGNNVLNMYGLSLVKYRLFGHCTFVRFSNSKSSRSDISAKSPQGRRLPISVLTLLSQFDT